MADEIAVNGSGRCAVALACALLPAVAWVAAPGASRDSAPAVDDLLRRVLANDPEREALMLTVEYQPRGSSLPHRHDAQVFVYVLEGAMTMQLDGKPPVTLRRGQTFYEGPNDIHRVSANASKTEPAKILVFMIKDKTQPGSRAVDRGAM